MEAVVKFREKLLVLMHLTGGQPARGTEIISIRHSNDAQAQHRNIFIEDGMVVYVTKYHKGFHMKGDVKIIHRYLLHIVGEMFVRYIWLVLPFQRNIEELVYQTGHSTSALLFAPDPTGKPWDSTRFGRALEEESLDYLGYKISLST